uniref:Toll-like recptor 4 n=1 Tax=Oncomelania hupensis TaxID=56141 RepID=A0A2H4HHV9_9CAEN|nr:toll-like recptor 4 [Oncomelania hupensis]
MAAELEMTIKLLYIFLAFLWTYSAAFVVLNNTNYFGEVQQHSADSTAVKVKSDQHGKGESYGSLKLKAYRQRRDDRKGQEKVKLDHERSYSWKSYHHQPQFSDSESFGANRQTCEVVEGSTKKGEPYNCFNKICWCTKTTADCSNSNLTFIPTTLPSSVRFLNFSNNGLTSVPRRFFDSVANLTSLSLSSNNISFIHPDAFKPLKRLRALFLSHNGNLTHVTLRPVFTVPSLQCVDIRYGNLLSLPEDVFAPGALPELRELFLHDNYIDVVNLTLFQHLPSLATLAWGENDVSRFYPGLLKNLDKLDLFSNSLATFPESCTTSGQSYFPKLSILTLKKNKLVSIPTTLCLPSLYLLDLSGNFFPVLQTDMFGPALFPRLGVLHLEQLDTHIKTIQPFAFRNPSLKFISLMYNSIDFSWEDSYSVDSFAGCPNMEGLQLSHNFLSRVSDARFIALFGHMTNLTDLYLGGVSMEQITKDTFASFPHLRTLQMYQNRVPHVPDGAFDHNPELQQLQLNENHISSVTQATFSEASRNAFKWLDLSGNPLICDCDLRWFSDLLRSNNAALSHHWTTYNCSNLNDLPVTEFYLPDQPCLISHEANVAIIAVGSVLLSLFVASIFLWRYRWQLRLKLYEVFRGRGDLRRQRLETGHFDYDAFVSYASEDDHWVTTHLMPQLEGRLKLKLCVHERDFVPGRHIVENIAQCVEGSKKILLVFSIHFLRSSWCQFELAVCLQHVIDSDDSLLTVCMGDIASRPLTSAMTAVMTTMTYIQWDEEAEKSPRKRSAFFAKLELALEDALRISFHVTSRPDL